MAWCPVCRYEYREGITECADCHVPLVEELPPEEADLSDTISIEAEMREAAEVLAGEDVEKTQERAKVYRSNAERAEEFKSSAWTLVVVGSAGLIAMILIMLGILPIPLATNIRYLSYAVMTLLFAGFLVVGVKSFGSAKKYALAAQMEEALTEEIHTWFMESFPREDIDSDAFSGEEEELTDIEKYYRRIENMKQKITANYASLDEAYLNRIADDFFHEIYE